MLHAAGVAHHGDVHLSKLLVDLLRLLWRDDEAGGVREARRGVDVLEAKAQIAGQELCGVVELRVVMHRMGAEHLRLWPPGDPEMI